MPEYFALPRADRRAALLVAAERSGGPLHFSRRYGVVWALYDLFTGPDAQHLVFNGGTSLSVLLQRCQALALKVNAAAPGAA